MSAFFFSVLGLEPTSDTKTIKRAYASALKKIDQELDPDAFGALRQAYERALDWANSAAGNAVGEAGGTGPAAQTADGSEASPQESAKAESRAYSSIDVGAGSEAQSKADMDEPSEIPETARGEGYEGSQAAMPIPAIPRHDTAEIEAALKEWIGRLLDREQRDYKNLLAAALADDRLLDIRASDWLAISLLRAINQDPHGRLELFIAAAERFGWRSVRGPLLRDPVASQWLMLLNDEMDRWDQQPENFKVPHQRAVDCAIEEAMPTLKQAGQYWPMLALLQQEFPNRLALQLPPARLAAWELAYNESPDVRLGKWDGKSKGWKGCLWLIALILFAWFFQYLWNAEDPFAKSYQPVDYSRAGSSPGSPYRPLGAGSNFPSDSSGPGNGLSVPSDLPALRGSNMFSPTYGGMTPGAMPADPPSYRSAPPSAWSSHSPIYTNPGSN